MPCPLPRRIEQVRASIASPLTRPSPNGRRVGIRIVTFEACSGFTHVTARQIAQPPKATFVTRLQPVRLPAQPARQLPDQSTTLRMESSSTDDSRLRGALPIADIAREALLRCQLIEQRFRLLQIARVEAFSEPGVHWRKQFARFLDLTLVAPEAREAHGGAEFK